MALHSFSEQVDYQLHPVSEYESWIQEVFSQESKTPGDINVILCSDEYLHSLNTRYLQHDTLTDVITFDYSEGKMVSGDIFISLDRVKENAQEYSVSVKTELDRVIVHGVLHLLGYSDKSQIEKEEMRKKEDHYLSLRSF